jgi:Gas vesicle protein G
MGLLSGLVTLPLAPLRGVVWAAGQVAAAAERERSDPALVYARLRELAGRLAAGEISEAEFEAAEDELLDSLD